MVWGGRSYPLTAGLLSILLFGFKCYFVVWDAQFNSGLYLPISVKTRSTTARNRPTREAAGLMMVLFSNSKSSR